MDWEAIVRNDIFETKIRHLIKWKAGTTMQCHLNEFKSNMWYKLSASKLMAINLKINVRFKISGIKFRACLKRQHVYEAVRSCGRVAEINFGWCLPLSTTVAAATRSKTLINRPPYLTPNRDKFKLYYTQYFIHKVVNLGPPCFYWHLHLKNYFWPAASVIDKRKQAEINFGFNFSRKFIITTFFPCKWDAYSNIINDINFYYTYI